MVLRNSFFWETKNPPFGRTQGMSRLMSYEQLQRGKICGSCLSRYFYNV